MPVESAQGWPDGGDAGDEDWHDDVIWPAETDQGVPWAGAVGPAAAGREAGRVTGHGRSWRPSPLVSLVAVAVLAAGAGAGLTIALTGPSGTPAARSGPTTGGGPGRAGGSAPGGMPSGQVSQMLVTGTVTAVSATSITIGGNGPAVTAAVTGSTRVTGRVHSIAGIKVGYQVSAQLTQSSGGRVTATAIQYPAEQGPGGIP